MGQAISEVVEAQGHLIDSHIMERIFDTVVEFGGALAGLAGATVIGRAGGERLVIDGLLDLAVSELHDARERGLLGFL